MSHAVINRWKVRREKEDDFIAGWARYTEILIQHGGAFGARLHRGEDGTFVAYSWWPSRRAWDLAQTSMPKSPARAIMASAIEERLPESHMEVVGEVFMPEEDAPAAIQYGDSEPMDDPPEDAEGAVDELDVSTSEADDEEEPDPNAPL